jgi:hypothetical protein
MTLRRFLPPLLWAVASVLPAAAEASSRPPSEGGVGVDVVGIRLGMSRDAAMDAFRRHLPGVRGNDRTVVFKGSPPVTVPLGYDGYKPGDQLVIAFSGPPSAPVVIEVQRVLEMERGKETNYGTMLAALTDKYGKPGYIDVNRMVHVWFLDGKGGDMTRANACNPFGRPAVGDPSVLQSPNLQPSRKNCGQLLYVRMNRFTGNPELIGQMDLNLSDNDAAITAFEATRQHIIAAGERLRSEEAEKAKVNRPKL